MICVFINMTGTPEGSTESGFMEKPGIEPATPGLQGIALIHYTTGALFLWIFYVISVLFCYAFVCVSLLMLCGHLLGKG